MNSVARGIPAPMETVQISDANERRKCAGLVEVGDSNAARRPSEIVKQDYPAVVARVISHLPVCLRPPEPAARLDLLHHFPVAKRQYRIPRTLTHAARIQHVLMAKPAEGACPHGESQAVGFGIVGTMMFPANAC